MNCPICDKGIKSKKFIHVPVKENGIITHYLKLTEGGKIHQQLLKQSNGILSTFVVKI